MKKALKHLRRAALCCAPCIAIARLLAIAPSASAQAPDYAPRSGAAYIMPGGAIQVVTSSHLTSTVRALNDLFVRTHPGVTFSLLEGDNYSAMAALTFDRSAFAPLGSEYTRIGLGDNLKIAAEPCGFRIAHASLSPGTGVPMLGVIVNPQNPLAGLTMAQLTRIFAIGASAGDIATWGQAAAKGKLNDRQVHPFGPLPGDYLDSDDPQAGEYLSTDILSGLNMNHRYLGLPHYSEVVDRVREDPAAIGITALNIPLTGVKVIPLTRDFGAPSSPTANQIAAGHYPLDRFIYIYLRAAKNMPLDAFGREYLRTVLSDEGQQVIAHSSEGYIPLNAAELAEERARLAQ